MPRIDPLYLDCVVYLYPTLDDAVADEDIGGSGFFAFYPLEEHYPRQAIDLDAGVVYAVTAKHVIESWGEVFIRLNTRAGDAKILRTDKTEWKQDPEHDLAVCSLGLSDQDIKLWAIPVSEFIEENSADGWGMTAPGDDAFFVGRYMTGEARDMNFPTVRFGHVALTPPQPFTGENGRTQLSFLVEAHSLNGYSGSPVIVYLTPAATYRSVVVAQQGLRGPQLLGVDWGHVPHSEPVLDETDRQVGKLHVKRTSGMMAVVPAWKLRELLEGKELQAMRDKQKKSLSKRQRAIVPDSAGEPEESQFERFEDLTRKLIDVPKSEIAAKRKGKS